MNDTATRPVTYRNAAALPVCEALMRYQLLERRDQLAGTAAGFRPRGRRHYHPGRSDPLTLPERLELLALGERLARHFRHPPLIHRAVQDGATWSQIAAALGETSFQVRWDYIQWVDAQRAMAEAESCVTNGMPEAGHVMALAIVHAPACRHCGSCEAAWDGNGTHPDQGAAAPVAVTTSPEARDDDSWL